MSEGTRSVDPSRIEIARLLAIAVRDLRQAQFEDLHLDTRFSLAYNAALQLATVTLRLHGIRVRKAAFHQRTFAELAKHIDPAYQNMAAYFDRARRKRNVVAYEQPGAVSESEVSDLIEQVGRFRSWVEQEVDKRMPTRGGPPLGASHSERTDREQRGYLEGSYSQPQATRRVPLPRRSTDHALRTPTFPPAEFRVASPEF